MKDAGKKKRFVAVGTGSRVSMFTDPIVRTYGRDAELVGLCDNCLTRARFHQKRLAEELGYREVAVYPASAFERMVKEQRADAVIVTSVDSTHHEYIVKALELGCEVVTEKPMTIDEGKCRAILDAVRRTGGRVRVAFNYRWGAGVTKVREILAESRIGQVKSVQLEYLLDTSHGADYFRRWHSYKECSGGLLVHKATHHFDLVNWWLDAIPQEVYAYGKLAFYGRQNALARGDEALTRYPRYTGVKEAENDPFRLTIDHGKARHLYLEAEEESGYLRDENVFREGINIEDTMSLLVQYRNGVVLNYSLNAFCPFEGFRVSFNGDRGRIEYTELHKEPLLVGQSDEEFGQSGRRRTQLRVLPLFDKGYEVEIQEAEGGHGGADPLLQEQIFSSSPPSDLLNRNAGPEQGAASILIGIAGNRSMEQRKPIRIDDLIALPPVRSLSELC